VPIVFVASKLVDSSTLHQYDLRTQVFQQPEFAQRTLQRLLSTNKTALQGLSSQQEFAVDRRQILAGTPLTELIDIGLKEQAIAPLILDALFTELSIQTKYVYVKVFRAISSDTLLRFPVLLAVDDFQALYCKSQYKDPNFNTIRSYHLSMPRLLLEFASGKRKFARGAVLGAISSNPAFKPPLELEEALEIASPLVSTKKRSKHFQEYASGLQKLEVPEQLSVAEATSLFDLWHQDNGMNSGKLPCFGLGKKI
jgi:small subunit ribosomal protein S29